MNPALFLALSFAGGLGASSRLLLDGAIRVRVSRSLPIGTITINLTGSLLLGLLVGLTTAGVLADAWRLIAGTGFLGGYTTFSTASFETVRLIQERKWTTALLNGLGTNIAATALAGLCLWIGSLA